MISSGPDWSDRFRSHGNFGKSRMPILVHPRSAASSNNGREKFPAGRTSSMVVTDRIQPYTRGERPQSSVTGLSEGTIRKARLKYGIKLLRKRAALERHRSE